MMTACFARALQRCTSRIGVHFLLIFQEVILISKTRNRLTLSIFISTSLLRLKLLSRRQPDPPSFDALCPIAPRWDCKESIALL